MSPTNFIQNSGGFRTHFRQVQTNCTQIPRKIPESHANCGEMSDKFQTRIKQISDKLKADVSQISSDKFHTKFRQVSNTFQTKFRQIARKFLAKIQNFMQIFKLRTKARQILDTRQTNVSMSETLLRRSSGEYVRQNSDKSWTTQTNFNEIEISDRLHKNLTNFRQISSTFHANFNKFQTHFRRASVKFRTELQ